MTEWGDIFFFADFNIVGASGWFYWNMILDTTGGPWLVSEEHNDPDPSPQQPVLVADPSTGKYYRTGVYYAMTHFGRSIKPGSFRIDARLVFSNTETNEKEDVNEQDDKLVSSSAFLEQETCTYSIVIMSKEWQEARKIRLILDVTFEAYISINPVSFSTLQFNLCG